MKKSLAILILIFAIALFSGCNDQGAPGGTSGVSQGKAMTKTLTAADIRVARQLVMDGVKLAREDKEKEALDKFDEALKRNPLEVGAYMAMAEMYEKKKETDKAIEAYDNALKVDPESIDLLKQKGIMLVRAKKYEDALKVFESIETVDPKDVFGYAAVARTYGLMKEPEKAHKEIEKAVEAMPDNPEVYELYASYLRRETRGKKMEETVALYDKCLQLYDKGLTMMKDEKDPKRIRMEFMKGDILTRKFKESKKDEDKKAAIDYLKAFVEKYKGKDPGQREASYAERQLAELEGKPMPPGPNMPSGMRMNNMPNQPPGARSFRMPRNKTGKMPGQRMPRMRMTPSMNQGEKPPTGIKVEQPVQPPVQPPAPEAEKKN